jgi:hypothetical protein
MKLFCSECRCFFDETEIVHKVETTDSFLYYHSDCLDPDHKVVAILSLKKLTETLEGRYEGQRVYHKICHYNKCRQPFETKSDKRIFCDEFCKDAHFNELKLVQDRLKRSLLPKRVRVKKRFNNQSLYA